MKLLMITFELYPHSMSFDTTAKVSITLDQLLQIVDQLSDKEADQVAARLAQKRKKDAVARMSATMGNTIWN